MADEQGWWFGAMFFLEAALLEIVTILPWISSCSSPFHYNNLICLHGLPRRLNVLYSSIDIMAVGAKCRQVLGQLWCLKCNTLH